MNLEPPFPRIFLAGPLDGEVIPLPSSDQTLRLSETDGTKFDYRLETWNFEGLNRSVSIFIPLEASPTLYAARACTIARTRPDLYQPLN